MFSYPHSTINLFKLLEFVLPETMINQEIAHTENVKLYPGVLLI